MDGDGRNRPGELRRWLAKNLAARLVRGVPARFLRWSGRGRRGGAIGGLRFARGLLNQRRRARPWELALGALWGEKNGEESEESEEDEDAVADEDLLTDHPLDLIGVVREGKVYLRGPSSFPERKSHGLLDVTSDA